MSASLPIRVGHELMLTQAQLSFIALAFQREPNSGSGDTGFKRCEQCRLFVVDAGWNVTDDQACANFLQFERRLSITSRIVPSKFHPDHASESITDQLLTFLLVSVQRIQTYFQQSALVQGRRWNLLSKELLQNTHARILGGAR